MLQESGRIWAFSTVGMGHRACQPNPMCDLYNLKASARDIGAVFDALDASGGALEKGYVSPGRSWAGSDRIGGDKAATGNALGVSAAAGGAQCGGQRPQLRKPVLAVSIG